MLDVSVGTVKSRILRGRQALREALEPVLKARPAADPLRSSPPENEKLRAAFSPSKGTFSRPAPLSSVSGIGGGE